MNFRTYSAAPLPPIAIDGYSYAIRISLRSTRDSVRITDGTYLKLSPDTTALRVARDGISIIEIPLQEAMDSVTARERRPRWPDSNAALRIEAKNGGAAALAYITQMSYRMKRHGDPKPAWLDGELFLKLPK
jgi:hypothetical protein